VALRPIERTDLAFLKNLGNDPGVRENVVDWGWPLSLSGQEKWFDSISTTQSTFRWLVEDLDGVALGIVGLWDVDWRNGTAMSAIKLGGGANIRGRGFGTDAIRATMEFAFQDAGLNRLYASILSTNVPSLTVYKDKLGWVEEGRQRQHVWRAGQLVDVVQVGILRSEYLSNTGDDEAL
jgi:RimJ/RimL family protein N-acetyltransferase